MAQSPPMRSRPRLIALLASSALLAAAVPAITAPAPAQTPGPDPARTPETATQGESRPQAFFRKLLLADRATARSIRDLLRTRRGFVDPTVLFADLTGDAKTDAIVRVDTGGAAGAIALYVFTTDGNRAGDTKLRAVYRSQALYRLTARARDGRLLVRVPRYEPGDELCCPAKLVETTLRWDAKDRRLRRSGSRELDGPAREA